MKIETTKPFNKDYTKLSEDIKERTDKKFALFLRNPRHPSLRIKKIEGYPEIWEGSITKSYRFTFQIMDNTFILRRIGTHDILRTT